MRSLTIHKPFTPPVCEHCGTSLETAATAQNPSGAIQENSLACCPSCLFLVWIGAELRPSLDHLDDEARFEAAVNASPEIREWALKTLDAARIRAASEVKAECTVARAWLIERGSPRLEECIAVLDEWAGSFDEKGYTRAPIAVRVNGSNILKRMSRETRH